MAQATLPGLLSVLRPVVAPTRSCRLHRLTPHCERAPARMNPACRDVPRGGLRKEPSAAGTSRAVRWFNPIVERHLSRPIVARGFQLHGDVIAMVEQQ